jgi:hypothetical protein
VFTIDPPKAKAMSMPQQNSDRSFDPDVLKVAQEIYNFYCQMDTKRELYRQPIGVAMNKLTYRGKLIFSSHPILLPDECFVSIQQLEAGNRK